MFKQKENYKKNLLIVFVKNLVVGNVKSRLALTIGYSNALEIYTDFQNKIHHVAIEIPFDKQVAYSSSIEKSDIWEPEIFNKTLQQGKDIGDRMFNAFSDAFAKGYEKVVLIGSDIINPKSEILMEAFNQLYQFDLVLGPAIDGGYYLMGLKKPVKQLFDNKDWSTNRVFVQTLKSSFDLGLSIGLVPELADLDRIEDFQYLEAGDWEKYMSIINKKASNVKHPYPFHSIIKGA